ncbi:MAG: CBS domain-containing protein [Venatoribacter sp.]
MDENKRFLGVINAKDLTEQAILSKSTLSSTLPNEILVTELMTKKQDLLALNIDEVKTASIGDVVNVLKDNHRQHRLVIDPEMRQIRGVFSASDISRKLQLDININDESSFSKVYSALS